MKPIISILSSVAVLVGTSLAYAAPELTVEDYCSPTVARPAGVKEMHPLADGMSYSAISDDEKRIEVFSYKTGKQTGVLFDIDKVKGDIKIADFDGYTLSSNEKWILLWNEKTPIYRHSFTAEFYVYDIMRSTLKRVSSGGAQRNATLSHDGRMVAYMRGNNLFISNLEYGTDYPITTDGEVNKILYGSPDWAYEEEFAYESSINWSADDSTLAFIRFDESEVPTYSFDDYKSYCDGDPLSDPYPEAYKYKYPLAGYPNSVVSVLAYNVDNRTTKTMDLPIEKTDYIPRISFDSTGKRLMVLTLNRDQNRMVLYYVNPASTVATKVLEESSDTWISSRSYGMLRFNKDSFVIASDRSGWTHLYEYDYSGTLRRQITSGDFNVTDLYGKSEKNGVYYVQTTSLGAINRNVASVAPNGKMTLLHPSEGIESADFSADFEYYLRCYSNATTPPQYTIWTTGGKLLAEVEMNAEYAAKYANAPKMEFLKVKNDDNEEMNAFIIKPLNFDPNKKYPLMMYQYNGPESQDVTNSWKMEGIFYVASQGYVVAMVDGRGTANRERSWATVVYKHLGHYEVLDQIAGAKQIASNPWVDENRMACFGWSFGGYMTLMELSEPGQPFKCGVSMAPVTDWRYYDSIYTERYMQTPQQNEAGYDSSSALLRTGNMNSPLLIMSGTSDDNVHFYNTLKYTSKLNFEGKLFDMMAYTGFEHSLRMCNARPMLFRRLVQFLNNNM